MEHVERHSVLRSSRKTFVRSITEKPGEDPFPCGEDGADRRVTLFIVKPHRKGSHPEKRREKHLGRQGQ